MRKGQEDDHVDGDQGKATSGAAGRLPWDGRTATAGRRHPGIRFVVVGVLSAAGLLAACSSSPSSTPTTTTSPPTTTTPSPSSPRSGTLAGKPGWIVANWAIAKFEKAGLPLSLVDYFFNNPRTYLIVSPNFTSPVDRQLPDATLLERFTSYATMQQAFDSGSILPGVKAIMYDNEAWALTPANEKAAPFKYAQEAQTLVHQHGMTFVFAPAVNLATLTSAGAASGSTDKYSAYLSQNLSGQGAKVSDIFDIQAQQAQATAAFDSFTRQAVAQAKAANPHVQIFVGIGPSPNGRTISAADILAAYRATRSEADGYWLNLPAGNAQCPNCGTAQPQVAVSFLESLATSLGQPTS